MKVKIIAKIYIGEHIEEIAAHLCKWLFSCIKEKYKPSEFKIEWNYFWWESDDYTTKKIPGITKINDNVLYWKDHLEMDDPDYFPTFYELAYKENVTEFIIFNNNSYIDIVAIRGKPSPKDIGTFVLAEYALPWEEEDTLEYLPRYNYTQK